MYPKSSTFKKALIALEPGKYIRVAHVAGNFTLPDDPSRPLLFIAGGIGITPLRSMLKYLIDAKQKRNIVLIYLANSSQEFVYGDVLKQAEEIGLKTHYEVNRLDASALKKTVPDLDKRQAYISGPDAMVSNYRAILNSLGMHGSSVKTDHFTGY
jgi:ferredoxin-NADP reductase